MVPSSSKYSSWVTGLRAPGAKSVIYDCLVTIALCLLAAPYFRILAPLMFSR